MTDTFTKAKRSRIMAAVKSKNTTPERIVRRLVRQLGCKFRGNLASLPGAPDLVFHSQKKVIFVHGCFWHLHGCARCRTPSSRRKYWDAKLARNAARDKRVRRELAKTGWQTLVVWECQTSNHQLEKLKSRLTTFLIVNPALRPARSPGKAKKRIAARPNAAHGT